MSSEVILLEVSEAAEMTGRLGELTRRVSGTARASDWALKLQLGPPARAAAITPAWAAEVAGALQPTGAAVRTCDTLSITTKGLDSAAGLREQAVVKGVGARDGCPDFRVADDPEAGASPRHPGVAGGLLGAVGLASGAADSAGLAVLTPIRPHPHTGFTGALMSLGLGLVDRETKLRIHQDIRPRVDTPLCAGCGSCLDVCIFDAIVIQAGRAHIDHRICTGCGECMNVCFMAGIAPEDLGGVPRFQHKVAEGARAARDGTRAAGRPALFFNFLVRPDRASRGPQRKREALGDVGVLAGTDPVALDAATADLIRQRSGGSLQAWSGFMMEPGPLLEQAAALGLGQQEYRLRKL